MRKDLQEKLEQDFPQIFVDMDGDEMKTCMGRGIETGSGWYDLIHKLCSDIMALKPGKKFKAEQVKEKFAGLRFYCSGYPKNATKQRQINQLINAAEDESTKICENCGTRSEVSVVGTYWIQTLCRPCVERKSTEKETQNELGNPSHSAVKTK